jgi:hypothetical protein
MPIKAFLSYSTRDKRLAGELRDLLSTAGIDLFLAHHTLAPSTEWRQEIKRQIASREVFVLLLTKDFHSSKWTDQEVGMAIAQRKTILPLQCPVRPYGFASDYQAISVTHVGESFWELNCRHLESTSKGTRIHSSTIRISIVRQHDFPCSPLFIVSASTQLFPLNAKGEGEDT